MLADCVQYWQVASLDMLARVYIHNDMLAEAAAVYNALASRTSGYGGANIDLDKRLQLFELALMQVRCLTLCL